MWLCVDLLFALILIVIFACCAWRRRRSSLLRHRPDPRAAARDGLSSVDRHLRLISALWWEAGRLKHLPLSSPTFFFSLSAWPRSSLWCLFLASPASAPDDFGNTDFNTQKRAAAVAAAEGGKQMERLLQPNCQNCLKSCAKHAFLLHNLSTCSA